MSVIDTGKIDVVATRPGSNVVLLVVADHLPWDDFTGHCEVLQAKLNTYIAFVESGQLLRTEEPKVPASPEVRISLAMMHPPPEAATEFLERARVFLSNIGIGLELRVGSGDSKAPALAEN